MGNDYLFWVRLHRGLKAKQDCGCTGMSYEHCLDFTYCKPYSFFLMSVRSVRTKNSWLCSSKVVVSWELLVFLGPKAARFMRDRVIPRSSDKWHRRDWSKIGFSTLKALNPLPVFHALRRASRTAIKATVTTQILPPCSQLKVSRSSVESNERLAFNFRRSLALPPTASHRSVTRFPGRSASIQSYYYYNFLLIFRMEQRV